MCIPSEILCNENYLPKFMHNKLYPSEKLTPHNMHVITIGLDSQILFVQLWEKYMRRITTFSSTITLHSLMRIKACGQVILSHPHNCSNQCIYLPSSSDGIPNDGIPIEDLVTVSLVLTIVYALLAVSGLVFAVVCVFFTLIFRNRKYGSMNIT